MEIIAGSNPIEEKDKSEALDFIFEHAFRSGFGTLNKSELDTILFAAIMKYGNKDYSDLQLSKYFQITQRRISSLKEKVSVKYSLISQREAIEFFIKKLPFAKKDDLYIDVPINDIAVKNEIEGLLDKYNILLHSQLNPKIFRIRIDDFFEFLLIIEAEGSEDFSYDSVREEAIKNIKSNAKILKQIDLKVTTNTLVGPAFKSKLLKTGIDVGLEVLKEVIPGGGLAIKALGILINHFSTDQ